MQSLRDAGLITKIDENTNEVQVNGFLWNAIDLDRKKDVVHVCALYFKARHIAGQPELVDSKTGRELASASEWSGVKIIE